MKKTGLVIVIIVCVIVLLSSLTAGILLTFRTIGWSALMDESNLRQRIEKILDDFQLEGFMFNERERFEIDEKRSFDLAGIKTVKITAVSESVLLTASGDQLEASLSGNYSSFGKKIEWITEKYMIPDSKIETNHLFWDTSPKSPGSTILNELNPF